MRLKVIKGESKSFVTKESSGARQLKALGKGKVLPIKDFQFDAR